MKTTATLNKLISPLKACAFLVLTVFSINAHAEYYYVEDAPYESSPKCVSLKRYKCVKRCTYHCKTKRVVKRYYYRPRPVVRYYEYYAPVSSPCGYYGCGYSSCSTCNGDYFATRYAYVCNNCDSDWVPGYMCNGRWVSGHWRY